MGSDGLFDNLYEKDITPCIIDTIDPITLLIRNNTEAAECLATKAVNLSLDKQYFSPFAQGAQKAGIDWNGGKPDDTTVVVA